MLHQRANFGRPASITATIRQIILPEFSSMSLMLNKSIPMGSIWYILYNEHSFMALLGISGPLPPARCSGFSEAVGILKTVAGCVGRPHSARLKHYYSCGFCRLSKSASFWTRYWFESPTLQYESVLSLQLSRSRVTVNEESFFFFKCTLMSCKETRCCLFSSSITCLTQHTKQHSRFLNQQEMWQHKQAGKRR